MKSYSRNNSRDKIDEQLQEFADAGVDAPDPDDDVVSNKRKAVDKLNELAEEHGYPYRLTEDDLGENSVFEEDGFEVGDVVLLEPADSPEEALQAYQEAHDSPEEVEDDEEEDTDDEPEEEEETTEEDEEDDKTEEQSEGDDIVAEAKASNEQEAEGQNVVGTGPASVSFTPEDDKDSLYEGEINNAKITGAHEKIHGGQTYVHFQLDDGTEKVLPQTEVRSMDNVTRNS